MLEPIPPTHPHILSPCFNSHGYGKLRQCWSLQDDADLDDGEVVEDPEYDPDITPVRLASVAGALHPSDSSRAYVFCDIRYVTIKMIPGIMDDTSDAVLPIPNNSNKHMYFFSNEHYAVINADPGTPNDAVIDGPKNIFAQWPSLKSAGFKTIDAVLPNPLNSEQAYFFRGDQYALIYIQQGPNKDYIVDGPKPMWSCLKDAGFKEITVMLPNPSSSNEVFAFAEDEY